MPPSSCRSRKPRALTRPLLFAPTLAFVALLVGLFSGHSSAEAQTWSVMREGPTLWQIVAIDASGESGWPYGREDIAGDGLGSFAQDEMAIDLRSVYADARADALWLRAYVASSSEPAPALRAFFFIDSDARDNSGGPAHGTELDEALAQDPSEGGYELAVGLRGNGNLLGVWQWDMAMRKWVELSDFPATDVRTELGSASDPLEIGAAGHGYVQLVLAHMLSGLTQSCGGAVFVRLLSDASPKRAFGDDAPEEIPCQSANDAYGDPQVLRPDGCSSDAECPANGVCRERICLFAYPCSRDADCRGGERCSEDKCVRVVSDRCTGDEDCDGLVCDGQSCVACSESGARVCANGLVCSPNGACLDPGDSGASGGNSTQGKVRGGAFSCASFTGPLRTRAWLLPLCALFGWVVRVRRRRVRTEGAAALRGRQP